MRLFIAINFEEQLKDSLQDIITRISKSAITGKFVSKEHMHLTLEFLGEIDLMKSEHKNGKLIHSIIYSKLINEV